MQIDEMTDEYVTCSVLVEERHQNALGGVMGGAIFTLADFAFAVMVNNIHRPTVAQNISIIFLNSPKGKKMFAKAVCKKDGRTTCVVNVDVYDEEDRPIAQFTGTGFKNDHLIQIYQGEVYFLTATSLPFQTLEGSPKKYQTDLVGLLFF